MGASGHAGHGTGLVAGSTPGTNGHNPLSEEEQIEYMRQLRRETVAHVRKTYKSAPSPIRTMARMMNEVHAAARKAGISPEVMRHELVNRTIGDVNVRMITEKIGGVDYSTIGEDLGIILPGEEIGGRISDGAVHEELNRREEKIELRLLHEYG